VDVACDLGRSSADESVEVRARDGVESAWIDIPVPTVRTHFRWVPQRLIADAGAFVGAIDAPHPQIPATGVLKLHVAFEDQPDARNVGDRNDAGPETSGDPDELGREGHGSRQ